MTKAKLFKLNVKDILAGKLKFKGLFGKEFKWSDFLIKGAKIIKKLPMELILKSGTQSTKEMIRIRRPAQQLKCKSWQKKMIISGKKVCRPKICTHGRLPNGRCKRRPGMPPVRPMEPMTIEPFRDR